MNVKKIKGLVLALVVGLLLVPFIQTSAHAQAVSLFVSPHQDDETLSMGMGMENAYLNGYDVRLLEVTCGANTTTNSNDKIITIERNSEQASAVAELHLTDSSKIAYMNEVQTNVSRNLLNLNNTDFNNKVVRIENKIIAIAENTGKFTNNKFASDFYVSTTSGSDGLLRAPETNAAKTDYLYDANNNLILDYQEQDHLACAYAVRQLVSHYGLNKPKFYVLPTNWAPFPISIVSGKQYDESIASVATNPTIYDPTIGGYMSVSSEYQYARTYSITDFMAALDSYINSPYQYAYNSVGAMFNRVKIYQTSYYHY
ncbi:PIG-L family deacetylase [Clostridium sp. WILCCON 0269]|uniref:PIG-L family deacetylase n=1 Tax=Candidatus Clostridium eludens TaxID=3381663 RepID=A0ABW8SRP0_9CLOT